jgi:hypothetical protein
MSDKFRIIHLEFWIRILNDNYEWRIEDRKSFWSPSSRIWIMSHMIDPSSSNHLESVIFLFMFVCIWWYFNMMQWEEECRNWRFSDRQCELKERLMIEFRRVNHH